MANILGKLPQNVLRNPARWMDLQQLDYADIIRWLQECLRIVKLGAADLGYQDPRSLRRAGRVLFMGLY